MSGLVQCKPAGICLPDRPCRERCGPSVVELCGPAHRQWAFQLGCAICRNTEQWIWIGLVLSRMKPGWTHSVFWRFEPRRYTMHRFLTHDSIKEGVFNRDFCSAVSAYSAWPDALTNSTPILELLLQRLEGDWLAMNPRLRRPFTAKDVDTWAKYVMMSCALQAPIWRGTKCQPWSCKRICVNLYVKTRNHCSEIALLSLRPLTCSNRSFLQLLFAKRKLPSGERGLEWISTSLPYWNLGRVCIQIILPGPHLLSNLAQGSCTATWMQTWQPCWKTKCRQSHWIASQPSTRHVPNSRRRLI